MAEKTCKSLYKTEMKNGNDLNIPFSGLQSIFLAAYSTLWSFAAIILLHYGLSNTEIGFVTSSATMAALFASPLSSSFAERRQIPDCYVAVVFMAAALALAGGLLVSRTAAKLTAALCFVAIGTALTSIPPILSSISVKTTRLGYDINYGLCRGVGSIAFSLTTFSVGFFMETGGVKIAFCLFVVLAALEILLLVSFSNKTKGAAKAKDEPETEQLLSILRKNPLFGISLFGSMFFICAHNVSGTYLYAIAEKVGAGESAVGITLAISAILEVPAMFLASRLQRRVSYKFLLCFAAAGGIVKNCIYYCAVSPLHLYIGASTQFIEFAIYIPATVYYVSKALPASSQLKGQSLIHVAGSGLGASISAIVSGYLLDLGGIRYSLVFGIFSACCSFTFFLLFTKNEK